MNIILTLAVSNWLGILVAAIAAMIVGFIWYSPFIFGKAWMKGERISQKESAEMMKNPLPMIGMFIGALIMATVLQIFFTHLNVTNVLKGTEVAIGAWIFVATSSFGMYAMSKRPKSLWVIQAAHLFISFIVVGIILVIL